jgi:CRISPR-associated protein Cmr1
MRAAPPPPKSTKRTAQNVEERRYRFLTYVFGGGVKVREHEKYSDRLTPIRVASVRGQLRFWWRACNPSQCTTIEELRRREGEIWGTTSQASSVAITVVSQLSVPDPVEAFAYNDRGNLMPVAGMREIAYGAFPLQPKREAQRQRQQPGVLFDYGSKDFTLRLTYPESLREDVKAALWAWETFGGLGGRTRRGFGAISHLATSTQEMDVSRVETGLKKYNENPKLSCVPSLHEARLAVAPQAYRTPFDAWKNGLGLLQRIRQGAGEGRNDRPPNTQKPAGRSRWPEPDEIRKLTGMTAPLHDQPLVSVDRFPRAIFGMPIVFHFHPGSPGEPGSMGDPNLKPLQLNPIGFERFASPLIIRPIPDGNLFRNAALVLSSDVPDSELKAGERSFSAEWRLDPTLAAKIPALKRGGTIFTDPIELFLSELKK